MASIVDFEIIRPAYECPQEKALEWVSKAHAKAEAKKSGNPECKDLQEDVKTRIFKVGFGREKVQKRGFVIRDPFHENWDEMQIYQVEKQAEGTGLTERSLFYDQYVSSLFEEFYPEGKEIAPHLIHVTCTGYVSPSGAQKIVTKRGAKSMVTHAYHMGCYASMPALRMANGFLHSLKKKERVDIVHSELCSLHMNPLFHDTEQLVVQSLFGDGLIKYSATLEDVPGSLRTLAFHEEIIPDTTELMTWKCADWGLKMTIAKEVPFKIAKSLEGFLKILSEKANLDYSQIKEAIFAVHPGGPKIISQVGKILELKSSQIYHSQKVLEEFGNMSSATLPHIWDLLLKDENIAKGTLIVSLAFGPGLTVCGAIFTKR